MYVILRNVPNDTSVDELKSAIHSVCGDSVNIEVQEKRKYRMYSIGIFPSRENAHLWHERIQEKGHDPVETGKLKKAGLAAYDYADGVEFIEDYKNKGLYATYSYEDAIIDEGEPSIELFEAFFKKLSELPE